MSWRWDQGRLEYFQTQNVRRIAEVLNEFDGELISGTGVADILRTPLVDRTGLMFPPSNDPKYKIWRNFGRVFGQQLLAAKIDNRLRVSEVCRRLADVSGELTDEEYIQIWVKRYTSPSPSFEDYDKIAPQVFPFCAVIKLTLARLRQHGGPVKAEDVVAFLIGNNVTGEEAIDYFDRLVASRMTLPEVRLRQIREMIAVLGQIPFLKWEASGLSIDRTALGTSFERDIIAYATPDPHLPRKEKQEEILNQGSISNIALPTLELPESSSDEMTFIEGSRKRMTHIRIERSSKLRQIYMQTAANPSFCNMCATDTRLKYPWTSRLIEVHHLLPLGSLLRVERLTTSLRDVTGICPTCHKATHQYYQVWLAANGLDDFRSDEEARLVYSEAKKTVVLAA